MILEQPIVSGATADNRTGLLIIRAWTEAGSSEPLRAYVRLSTDVTAGIERTLTLCRSDEVCATVGEWLSDFLTATRLDQGAGSNSHGSPDRD